MNKTTFEHAYNEFFDNYENEIYNYLDTRNSDWFEEELQCTYNEAVKVQGQSYSPSLFFRDVANTMLSIQDNYDNIDLLEYLNKVLVERNEKHDVDDDSYDPDEDGNRKSLLQSYFDDVKHEYDHLPDGQLEFCEENREAILNSNLKMVISTAKHYQNRGLSLEDLIGAGNVGLCTAWDRYKPEHNVLRKKILTELEECPETLSKEYIDSLLSPFVKYGDIKDKYDAYFHSFNKVYTRDEVLKWVNKNIRKAKFSSVAQLWIRAYILQELDGKSRIVKKPKREIDKDLEETGRYVKEKIVSIAPLADIDNNSPMTTRVELSTVDDTENNIDEYQDMVDFKINLNKLLVGINNRDRRILFKSFGIGLPRSMEPREIAETESLSVARVSQVILDSISKMKTNAKALGLTMDDLKKFLR